MLVPRLGGVPKRNHATRVDFCASRPCRDRHSVIDTLGPVIQHFLDLRQQQLFGCWIWLRKSSPVEIAKVCETICLVHSALSNRVCVIGRCGQPLLACECAVVQFCLTYELPDYVHRSQPQSALLKVSTLNSQSASTAWRTLPKARCFSFITYSRTRQAIRCSLYRFFRCSTLESGRRLSFWRRNFRTPIVRLR